MAFVNLGCSSEPELGRVTGQVLLNGEPVPDARVIFRPEYGRMSQDMTDHNGRYELQYTIDSPGARLGKHQVRISTAEATSPSRLLPEMIPDRYHASGALSADVTRGENVIDFELVGKSPDPELSEQRQDVDPEATIDIQEEVKPVEEPDAPVSVPEESV